MDTPQFTRGIPINISDHPCTNSTTNSTSECCKFDLRNGECGLFFHDTFQHPCALCTSEELPIPRGGLCNFCTEAYPEEGMDNFMLQNGTVTENLSQHECAISNGNETSKCCLYDSTTDQCGIFYDDKFAYPCGSCSVPPTNKSIDEDTIRALIFTSVGIVVVVIIFFIWKGLHYRNLPEKMMVIDNKIVSVDQSPEQAPSEDPSQPVAIPIGYETEGIEVTPIAIAVPMENSYDHKK